jgi:hypothetical protein
MATEEQLRVKIRKTEINVDRAQEEVLELMAQLKSKTLDQATLESGLKNVTRALGKVPHFCPFWPHFKARG